MAFRIKIDTPDIDIQGKESITDHKDFDLTPSEFMVDFDITIEYREWGIRDISIYATKVSGSVFLTDMDTNEEKEIVCNDFKIENDFETSKLPVKIENLNIDLKDKIIFVS